MQRNQRAIPAFLSIDVEPDGFQEPNLCWTGFESILDTIEGLRADLGAVSGVAPRFGWYLRMDPQVAAIHGRPDHLAVAYADVLHRLAGSGDVFGSHIHAVRLSDDGTTWVHEVVDPEWAAHCIEVAFDAHASAFGGPPERHRYGGGGFIDDGIVGLLDEHGVTMDLTLEPGVSHGRRAAAADVQSGVDSSPRTGAIADCRHVPRHPYRPAHRDFRAVGNGHARSVIMVPLSSTRLRPGKPLWRQAGGTIKRRARALPQVLRMAPWAHSPAGFWDLAAAHLRASARPYLSLALRTDAPSSGDARRVRAVLAHLPCHPLARRLRFVDPLEAVPALM